MPTTLQPKIDAMPRQAIYTLASRPGSNEIKEEKKRIELLIEHIKKSL